MSTFSNKVVLVTGGTSGIGRVTAIAFAAEGASVILTGRRKPEGEAVVAEITKAGGKATFVQGDVADEAQVKTMVQAALDTYGRLDIAFNNAGVESNQLPITDETVEGYERIFNINVKGVFLCMKHEIPAMLKTGGGSIINTASVLGHICVPNSSLYNATKHAVLGLTKTVALENAKNGIRVNAVSPAVTESEMIDRIAGPASENGPIRQYLTSLHPIGRIARPEEIASAVLYLASPGASFVTGQDIIVDGGLSVQ